MLCVYIYTIICVCIHAYAYIHVCVYLGLDSQALFQRGVCERVRVCVCVRVGWSWSSELGARKGTRSPQWGVLPFSRSHAALAAPRLSMDIGLQRVTILLADSEYLLG